MQDASQIPAIVEPWFLAFDASVEMHPVMAPDDLMKASPAIEQAVNDYFFGYLTTTTYTKSPDKVIRINLCIFSFFDSPHVRPELYEFVLHLFVSPVEMVYPVDFGLAFCSKGRHNQRSAGPEVSCH